ncbi:hypothetical protein F4802DRAFT_152074 [Xylaria palmicola]|nr:hypothetical protein F4802DRAFT_152074 [Xylaria palmicola]
MLGVYSTEYLLIHFDVSVLCGSCMFTWYDWLPRAPDYGTPLGRELLRYLLGSRTTQFLVHLAPGCCVVLPLLYPICVGVPPSTTRAPEPPRRFSQADTIDRVLSAPLRYFPLKSPFP